MKTRLDAGGVRAGGDRGRAAAARTLVYQIHMPSPSNGVPGGVGSGTLIGGAMMGAGRVAASALVASRRAQR